MFEWSIILFHIQSCSVHLWTKRWKSSLLYWLQWKLSQVSCGRVWERYIFSQWKHIDWSIVCKYLIVRLVTWAWNHDSWYPQDKSNRDTRWDKEYKRHEKFSAICYADSSRTLYLTSYAFQTKSKRKRNVLVLSTMRPLNCVTRDDGCCKPSIIKFYDFTKGGSYIIDQLNDYYTCQYRRFRWDFVP